MMSSRTECVFFFQAEDGIRDLVRSRGLGDVYKRQALQTPRQCAARLRPNPEQPGEHLERPGDAAWGRSVSYTHLTLPTSDLV